MDAQREDIIELKAQLQLQEKKLDRLLDFLEKEGVISRREFEDEFTE